MRAFQILVSILIGVVIGITASAFAWIGPTASPPSGNVAAPINVSSASQTKTGTLGVGGLTVQSDGYLNWGSVSGTGGYGIWDNAGTLEFKNSGGSWQSIQTIMYNYFGGGASQWTTSGSNIYYTKGDVGIGTTNPTYQLQVSGNEYVSGNIYWGTGGNWLSAYLNQAVTSGASPTFNNVDITSRGMWMSEAARDDGGQFGYWGNPGTWGGQCPGGSVQVGGSGGSTPYFICQWIN